MQCGKCGESLAIEAKFCGECGEKVTEAAPQDSDRSQSASNTADISDKYCATSLGNAIHDAFSLASRNISNHWWVLILSLIGATVTGALKSLAIAMIAGILVAVIARKMGVMFLGGRRLIGDAEIIDADNVLILKTNILNVTVDKLTLETRVARKSAVTEYVATSPKHLRFLVGPVTKSKEKFVPGTFTGTTIDGRPVWGYTSTGGMSYTETISQGFYALEIRNSPDSSPPIELKYSCSARVADVVKVFVMRLTRM